VGLTSVPYMSLMVAAAVGSLAGIVWRWPRTAGRRPADIGARLGLIAGSQLLVIAALLACLNGYFSFYGSWSALFGIGTPQLPRAAGAAVLPRPIVVTGADLGPGPGGNSVLPLAAGGALAGKAPHYSARHHQGAGRRIASGRGPGASTAHALASVGEVLQVNVMGQRTGIAVASDYVYLPPQYFQPAYARARFPVVLALTGYPNDPWSIVKRLALPATAARLVAAGRIRPAVYVMMNVSVVPPRDTECTNVPAGPQVASFFALDVPRAVEQTFRVQTSASGWSVIGYSTGGYCAAKLAMMYPGQFSSAVSIAGYYAAYKDQTTGNIYGGSQAYRSENDLAWRLKHLPAPPVSVLVTSSRVGEKDLPVTLAFLRLIHSPMRGYSLLVPQGGHNYGTWDRELPQSLEWLSHRLTPARPHIQHVVPGG
jgi:enterochelin esterase-like enzyme